MDYNFNIFFLQQIRLLRLRLNIRLITNYLANFGARVTAQPN